MCEIRWKNFGVRDVTLIDFVMSIVSGYNIPQTGWAENGGRDLGVAFHFLAPQSILNYPATIGVSNRLSFRV